MNILRGRTSQIISLQANDTASFNGGGKTGLAFNTAGLIAYYKRELATSAVAISLATATVGVWASGGFVEIDAAHLPGSYELSIPNLAIGAADASTWVEIYLSGAVGAYFQPMRLDLVAYDAQAADFGLANAALPTVPLANTWGEALFAADILLGRINQAQAGAATTITLDSGASSDSTSYVGDDIYLYGGTGGGIRGSGQRRTIIGYVGSTKVANVNRAWSITPDNTSKFMTLPGGGANVLLWKGAQPNDLQSGRIDSYIGAYVAQIVTDVQAGLATLAKLKSYVRLLARKDTAIKTDEAVALGEINANVASGAGSYDNTTDSQQAIAANEGGGGGATPAQIWAYAISLLTDPSTIGGYIKSQLAAIYAKQTATNGVVLIDGFSPDAKTLHLTQYATHLALDNNALSLTVYVPVDPTDGTPILTLKLSNTPTNHAGTLTNYDPTTQLATLSFELTAAHVAPDALPSGGQFSLGVLLDNGTLIPISYPRGAVIVDPAGNPAAAVAP